MKLYLKNMYFKEKKRDSFDYDCVFVDIFNNMTNLKDRGNELE